MRYLLPAAFGSNTIGWLTIFFFFTSSAVTYFKRIDQFRKLGSLPMEAQSAPAWLHLPFVVAELACKISLLVLNWQYGLVLYILGFVLAWLGVLENVGALLMYPLVRTPLPDMSFESDAGGSLTVYRDVMLPAKKRHFAAKLVWIVAWYVGLTCLLNRVVRPMDSPAASFIWMLAILQVFMYFYIFSLSYMRLHECRSRIAKLVVPLAFLGRVNDFQLVIIPLVVLMAIIISSVQTLPSELTCGEGPRPEQVDSDTFPTDSTPIN